jgi:3-oxoacyl-[acyl-carrier protein] reductase
MSGSLKGKPVIVTGGSKGIGKGIARVVAGHGAKVLIVARHVKDAEAAAQELSKGGATVSALAADVTRLSDMEAMAKAAVERHGGLAGQTIIVDGGQVQPESLEALASA